MNIDGKDDDDEEEKYEYVKEGDVEKGSAKPMPGGFYRSDMDAGSSMGCGGTMLSYSTEITNGYPHIKLFLQEIRSYTKGNKSK